MSSNTAKFEIFLGTAPGLEPFLLAEAQRVGFADPVAIRGGVTFIGNWHDVWQANLTLRGASKVLVRFGDIRAFHLAQLDKRARKFPWGQLLTKEAYVKVEVVTNRKSKIYHAGAAVERIERAIAEELGAPIAASVTDADVIIKVRNDDNNLTLSVDSSGEGLHKRGHKQAMGKAPLRETMAALALYACGFDGQEAVIDPMCGSGTFIIEAAEIARNHMAGRARKFAFERFQSYDADAIAGIKADWKTRETPHQFFGSDRNVNVVGFANVNAERAGVADICHFAPTPLDKVQPPDVAPGLVMVNPPYGARIGKKKDLFGLYASFGEVIQSRFKGWRVGMITADEQLARATKLKWTTISPPIAHGGLRVKLYQTKSL